MQNEKHMSNENTTKSLAIERTQLANERSFLAYFRTFIVFFSSSLAIFKIEDLYEIRFLAILLLITSILILLIGTFRFFQVRKRIKGFID